MLRSVSVAAVAVTGHSAAEVFGHPQLQAIIGLATALPKWDSGAEPGLLADACLPVCTGLPSGTSVHRSLSAHNPCLWG